MTLRLLLNLGKPNLVAYLSVACKLDLVNSHG